MTETMIRHLTNDIAAFEESVGKTTVENVKLSTSDRIVAPTNENSRHNAVSRSEAVGT